MRIALLGYGKMGKSIEQIALQRGHSIDFLLDLASPTELEMLDPNYLDVAIEFSVPDAAFKNLKACMQKGIKAVSGTTGWLERKPEIEAMCKEHAGAFFYASNYSIGVNLFFKLNEHLAKLMNGNSQYAVSTSEIHHTEKLDSPSGTAITLAEGLIENLKGKTSWVNQKIAKPNEIPIWSSREGNVPGTHAVKYISDIDEIEIIHQAKNREGFALGAVIAAEWLCDKTGVFSMKDMLSF